MFLDAGTTTVDISLAVLVFLDAGTKRVDILLILFVFLDARTTNVMFQTCSNESGWDTGWDTRRASL